MGAALRTFHILVIGLKDAGKTHFLDMMVFGPDSTKNPTIGFYYQSVNYKPGIVIEMTECPQLQTLRYQNREFEILLLMVDANATFEELQSSKNMMFSLLHKHNKVCVMYNIKPGSGEPTFDFRQRNRILELHYLGDSVSAIEIRFEDDAWREKIVRLFDWIVI